MGKNWEIGEIQLRMAKVSGMSQKMKLKALLAKIPTVSSCFLPESKDASEIQYEIPSFIYDVNWCFPNYNKNVIYLKTQYEEAFNISFSFLYIQRCSKVLNSSYGMFKGFRIRNL